MTDYISRDAIGLTDFEIILCQADENKYKSALVMLLDKIEKLPAVDVREVVLCRDCSYYRQSNFVDKHMECARSGFPVHPVDFCSLADMREEQT